ncbi:hypothetical protein IAU59_003898 [Kwoniella sp. CBS 9459]
MKLEKFTASFDAVKAWSADSSHDQKQQDAETFRKAKNQCNNAGSSSARAQSAAPSRNNYSYGPDNTVPARHSEVTSIDDPSARPMDTATSAPDVADPSWYGHGTGNTTRPSWGGYRTDNTTHLQPFVATSMDDSPALPTGTAASVFVGASRRAEPWIPYGPSEDVIRTRDPEEIAEETDMVVHKNRQIMAGISSIKDQNGTEADLSYLLANGQLPEHFTKDSQVGE